MDVFIVAERINFKVLRNCTEEGHHTVTLVTLNCDLCKTDVMENVTRKNKMQKENKQKHSALF